MQGVEKVFGNLSAEDKKAMIFEKQRLQLLLQPFRDESVYIYVATHLEAHCRNKDM